MWNVVKTIGKVLAAWLGICGAFASLYAIRADITATAENIAFHKVLLATISKPTFIVGATCALPLIAFAIFTHLNLKARGHVSLRKFLRRLNPLVFGRVCIQLHRLEHLYQDMVHFIRDHRKEGGVFDRDDFKRHVYLFLTQCKYILDLSTGDDVAVHIKLFEHKKTDGKARIPLPKAILKAYVRAPSQRECILVEQQKLSPRESDEEFRIIRGNQGLASRMIERKDKLDNALYRHCSGYNHVFSDPEHFFLCNNIPRKARQGRFYSTSNNYHLYYRSAGVFLIHQHLQYGETVNHDPLWGLLIVDSFAVGVFEKFITKYLAGYMAHRLFDAFSFAEQIGAVGAQKGTT
ncbi:MAG TPA: hypothetical protein PKC67_12945 [Kiritimatiellia bacterium]|nr:hypothetical protein [Kiritimatiellia bacterium]HMP35243.1 hypothetical protein [Kiritimatiellia bacterium]